MPTTAQLSPPHARSVPASRAASAAPPDDAAAPPTGSRTLGDALSELLPLAGSVAFYGPPVGFIMGPWVLMLMVGIGPLALLLTLALVFAVALALVAGFVALVVVAPYMVLHRLVMRRAATPAHAVRDAAEQSDQLPAGAVISAASARR